MLVGQQDSNLRPPAPKQVLFEGRTDQGQSKTFIVLAPSAG
jgi:hypothetical protein